jgi:kumamolisin
MTGADAETSAVTKTLVLRRRNPLPSEVVEGVKYLRRADFVARYATDPTDVDIIERGLTEFGLTLVQMDHAARQIVVNGPSEAITAFLAHHRDAFGSGSDALIQSVHGGDNEQIGHHAWMVASQPQVIYSATEIGAAYGFPAHATGAGRRIAIVSIEGGYATADMTGYFDSMNIPVPNITDVSVGGVGNNPGSGSPQADREVLLDLQIAGALAPGAELINYFTSNTDQGILRGVAAAVHASPAPTVMSLSWGAPETIVTPALRVALHELFADAAALGITIVAAAGNQGSASGIPDGGSHVMFPGSSPYVLACGGTTLFIEGGAIVAEQTWNAGSSGAGGGGVSEAFDLPPWQTDVDVPPRHGTAEPGRGVPDVAAVADPATGYEIYIDGRQAFVGGTSAATPYGRR